MDEAERLFRQWFDSVIKKIGWGQVRDASVHAKDNSGHIIGSVWEAQIYLNDKPGDTRRLTEEFKADTGNDESSSTQNGFGWLVTVTTIITAAMIGFSFYLFAPMRAVRM